MSDQELDQWLNEVLAISDDEDKMTEKQIKILKAAVEIFSEKGYAASSTSEIAQKAGVAEGTIFRHYKTKKELLLSIVAPVMTRFVAPLLIRDFTKVIEAPYPSFEQFLRAILWNRYEFAKRHLPVLKIMLQEIPFHPELRQQFVEHVGKKVIDRFIAAIEHFQAQGLIVDAPPASVIRFNISAGAGLLIARFILLPDLDWDDQAEVERTIDFIVNGIGKR
jgi:AcrR family transcriptional regulator